MITSALALSKFLENLWKLLTAFQLTTDDAGSLDDTFAQTQAYYSCLDEQAARVRQIKGSTAQTQGPDGTLSSTSLNSVNMILLGLNRLKEKVNQLNPAYVSHLNVRSLLTLFVDNFFSSMRAGNTATPTMLDFSLHFPRCTTELLKKVTDIPFNYFTNPGATYYLQPSMKDVTVKFSELAMLPKPRKGCLTQKQLAELRQWASINGRSVRQNTTRNFSTKDKPGTLPLNVYQTSPPKEKAVNFSTLLQDESRHKESASSSSIIHAKGTYVAFPQSCRPTDVPASTFYIVKLLEDLLEDDHVTHVKTEWFSQDFVDPLLFVTTGTEHLVSKDGMRGTVTSVRTVTSDTVEISESDYYILLASLHSSEDSVFPHE